MNLRLWDTMMIEVERWGEKLMKDFAASMQGDRALLEEPEVEDGDNEATENTDYQEE